VVLLQDLQILTINIGRIWERKKDRKIGEILSVVIRLGNKES